MAFLTGEPFLRKSFPRFRHSNWRFLCLEKAPGIKSVQCSETPAFEAAQAVIVCVASSFSWVSLLTPLIVLISIGVAFLGVRSARASARQRATLDMIEKVESAPHYRSLHAVFSYHRRQDSFSRLHNPTEDSRITGGKIHSLGCTIRLKKRISRNGKPFLTISTTMNSFQSEFASRYWMLNFTEIGCLALL